MARRSHTRIALVAAAAVASCSLPAAAHAATRTEAAERVVSETVQFRATGCDQPSIRVVVFPKNAAAITPDSPLKGTQLYAPGNPSPVAVVSSVSYEPGLVTWTVTGIGASCEPGTVWETARVDLKVDVTVQRTVLTRATVIARGDRICDAGIASIGRALATARSGASRARVVATMRRIAQVTRTVHRRLGALQPERSRRTWFQAYRRALDQAQVAADNAADARAGGDRFAFNQQLAALDAAARRGRAAARRYGFRGACAR